MSADQHAVFLLVAMLTADAVAGEPLSQDKQRKLDDILQERFPGLGLTARWQKVAEATEGKADFADGIALVRLIEASARVVGKSLKGQPGRGYRLVKQLRALAESDGRVTDQELLVLRAVAHNVMSGQQLTFASNGTTISIA